VHFTYGQFVLLARGQEMTMTEASEPVPEPKTRVYQTWRQTWAQVLFGLGLGLAIIWMIFLALALVKILELAL
jgi:hypothetical protein